MFVGELGDLMTENLFVQYVGFKVMPLFRRYSFNVHITGGDVRVFTLMIANEAFDAHRARFQDAPSICSIKLRNELADDNSPVETSYSVTDMDLAAYRDAHWQKPSRNPYARKVN
jgi:hypothetical protein